MATITLVTPCPACIAAKKMNRLMQKLGEDAVFCKEGHKFSSAESLEPVVRPARKKVSAVPTAVPQEAAPVAVAVADPPPNLEEVASPLDVLEEEEQVTQFEGQTEVVPDFEEAQPTQPIDAEYVDVDDGEPAGGLAHAVPPSGVVPGSVREIEGKNLELRYVIPEEHVSSLQAVAESMGKTMEEYFTEIVNAAFSNGWFW